jgi:hypothetical protein
MRRGADRRLLSQLTLEPAKNRCSYGRNPAPAMDPSKNHPGENSRAVAKPPNLASGLAMEGTGVGEELIGT